MPPHSVTQPTRRSAWLAVSNGGATQTDLGSATQTRPRQNCRAPNVQPAASKPPTVQEEPEEHDNARTSAEQASNSQQQPMPLIVFLNQLPPVATLANHQTDQQTATTPNGINAAYVNWSTIKLTRMDADDRLNIKGENWLSWVSHQHQILDQYDLLPFIDMMIEIPTGVEGDSLCV